MKFKYCPKCKTKKQLSDFHKDKGRGDGRCSYCRICKNKVRRKSYDKDKEKYILKARKYRKENPQKAHATDKKYYKLNTKKCIKATVKWRRKKETGMTPAYYDAKYDAQEGCCEICGKHQSKLEKALSGDHRHSDGKLRGLLCSKCNLDLGKYERFLNNKDLTNKYDVYLKKYE